jgi:thioesterase domain-containing protein
VYALQARGLTQAPALSLDEMADDYVRTIRGVRKQGPYCLLGWSFGGKLAHAVAARLRTAGEHVALLAVLDAAHTDTADTAMTGAHGDDRALARLAFDGLDATAGPPGARPDEAARRQAPEAPGSPLAALPDVTLQALLATTAHHVRLSRAAPPPAVFDGDVFFVEATTEQGTPSGLADTWRPYVGGRIHRHVLAHPHLRMLGPPACACLGPVLARQLSRAVHHVDTPEVGS